MERPRFIDRGLPHVSTPATAANGPGAWPTWLEVDGPMMPDECCFPNCHASLSRNVHVPLCDRHAVKVYRSVAATMADLNPDTPAAFASTGKADPGRSNRTGLVYFIRFGDRVKIGFTTDLAARLTDLPHDEVLVTVSGTMHDEKALHRRFAEHRVHREWFALVPDITDHIATIREAAA